MRIVLFYSEVESFNYFSDVLAAQLQARGHEAFIFDLTNPGSGGVHSLDHFIPFISKKVDMVICFDGLGILDDVYVDIWNEHQAAVMDLMMDPPIRFHPVFRKHPRNYHLLCCDRDHIEYVKKYFSKEVSDIRFMPHAGTLPSRDEPVIPYASRSYDILFSGTYYRYQDEFMKLKSVFSVEPGTKLYSFYEQMFGNLTKDSHLTIDQAFCLTMDQCGWTGSEDMVKRMLAFSEPVDWAVRMYYRERVITVLAEAGLRIHLLGRGWENYPLIDRPNVYHIDERVPFAETLPFMADAKLCLNVFPWFKSGSHDRIFNTFLQHSLPLTDYSHWIADHFTDGVDIAMYDLAHLERLPGIVEPLLADSALAEHMIQKGYEKVSRDYTWANCVDRIMEVCGKSE